MTAKTCKHCSQPIPPDRIRCVCIVARRVPRKCKGCATPLETGTVCDGCRQRAAKVAVEGQRGRIEVYMERARRGQPLFEEVS